MVVTLHCIYAEPLPPAKCYRMQFCQQWLVGVCFVEIFFFPLKQTTPTPKNPIHEHRKEPFYVCYTAVSCLKLLGWAFWDSCLAVLQKQHSKEECAFSGGISHLLRLRSEYFLASCHFHFLSLMTSVLCNEAVRDQLALLRCETSVNSAGNVGDVSLYQIISL